MSTFVVLEPDGAARRLSHPDRETALVRAMASAVGDRIIVEVRGEDTYVRVWPPCELHRAELHAV